MRPVTYVFALIAGLAVSLAEAATCTSNAVGNWNAAATWTNCAGTIPQDGDAVVVNHAVTLNADTNDLASLTINSGGSLSLSGSTSYDIYLGGNLVNHGLLDFQSSSGTNTIYLSGSGVTSTFSGDDGTWLLDNLDLNGRTGHICSGTCKIELSGSPHLKFSNSSLFADNSSTKLFNPAGNATATVELNRLGSQSIQTTGVTYPNLIASGSGTKTPNSGTLTILGSLTVSNGTTFNANSSDPTINVSGSLTNAGTFTASGSRVLTVTGSLSNTGTFTGSGDDFNLGGNFTQSGSFTAGSGTWTFNGSSAQSILAGTPTFQRLTLNNASGLTLASGNVTVTTALTYSAGKITTGSYTLIYSGTCPSSAQGSASSHVLGNLRLTVASGSSTCFFDVGDATGYAPVTTAFTGASSGTLTARADVGDHADTGSGLSGIDGTKSANHYWTLTAGTLSSYTSYSATFRYCASTASCTATEVDTGAATGSFVVANKSGGSWSTPTVGTRTAYSAQATGLTSLGEFAVGEAATVLCFTDSFNRSNGAPGSNWTVGAQYGSHTPAISSNRLRLTDTGASEGTWATLQRYFPAAGNKITIDFDHYAYGGTGADGIAVILSNAGVAPVVGAFGGSLGYAPKSELESDCTNPGGCPGFTGGWLGVAIDEYGNFQNPTEGRIGGPGQVPDSVSVRGSGSGMSGYRYMTGSSTLSPGVDGSFSPAHHYRITVDHSDGVHAYVTVERDTTSGGSNYVAVIPQFDAKDLAYSQDAVPSNWQLSFTGSSGGLTNIHEIDALQVCTITGISTPTLHHIRLSHGGSACTGSSNPASVTVKACANADCTSLYLGSVTVDLNGISGATWSSDPVTFSGGETTVTLAKTTAGSVTLGGSATSPTTANATRCFNGATETCTLTYAACYLDAVETGAAAYTPIYTKLAGQSFNLDVKNVSGGWQTVSKVEIVNAGSGSNCAAYASLSSSSGSWTFWSSQTRNFSFSYANAVRNARIRITSGSGTSCSTDNFAIRPVRFTLSSTANGTALKAAGDTFSVTATAVNGAATPATTTAYDGTPAFDLTTGAIKGKTDMAGTANTPVTGTLGAAVFGAASAGVAVATGLSYSEVGCIEFAANAVNDDAFAAVDSDKTSPECTSSFSNVADANGMYGCMIGADAVTLGRFVPHHFSTTLTHGCAAGSFTYSRQPFDATVTARNGVEGVTTNYAGTLARAVTLSDGGSGAVPCTTNCSVAATSFTSGIATLNAAASLQPTFAFASALTAPATLALRALETAGDGVTSAGATEGTTALRSGRLRLSNAFGSEKSPLTMTVQAQYWSGNSWVLNSGDTCTTVPANAFALSSGITAVNGAVTIGVPSGGNGILNLTAPGAGNVGSVDIAANLGATNQDQSCLASHPASTAANLLWLRSRNGNCAASSTYTADPSARATFGIYSPESRRTVHVREVF